MRKTILAAGTALTMFFALTSSPNTTEGRYLYNGARCWIPTDWPQDNSGYANNIESSYSGVDDHRGKITHYTWDCSGGSGTCSSFKSPVGGSDCHWIFLREGPEGIGGTAGGSGSVDFYEDEGVVIIPD